MAHTTNNSLAQISYHRKRQYLIEKLSPSITKLVNHMYELDSQTFPQNIESLTKNESSHVTSELLQLISAHDGWIKLWNAMDLCGLSIVREEVWPARNFGYVPIIITEPVTQIVPNMEENKLKIVAETKYIELGHAFARITEDLKMDIIRANEALKIENELKIDAEAKYMKLCHAFKKLTDEYCKLTEIKEMLENDNRKLQEQNMTNIENKRQSLPMYLGIGVNKQFDQKYFAPSDH